MLYDEKNNALRFVDFEYGSYNYRGFDLANHFCECCGFECEWENFPTAEEQKRFGRAYLTAADGKTPTDEQVEALYTEVQPYIAASHFFWGIWALVQAKFSVVDFDYLGYGHERLVGGLAAFRDHCEAFLPSVSADE